MSASAAPATASSRVHLTTRMLRLTGGDPARTAQMRAMMWSEYCDAGAPLGRSEDGMFAWWDQELSR